MCTFEHNLSRLLQLKDEAQTIMTKYQTDRNNKLQQQHSIQMESEINMRDSQIEQLRSQSTELQDHYEQQMHISIQKIESLKSEIFLQNQELDEQDTKLTNEINELKSVIQQLQCTQQTNQQQYQREIDNMKLMHQQELYILKKKK